MPGPGAWAPGDPGARGRMGSRGPVWQRSPWQEYEDDGTFPEHLFTEEEVKEYFSSYGEITSAHLPLDAEKRGKGYGFIHFLFPECADRVSSSTKSCPMAVNEI